MFPNRHRLVTFTGIAWGGAETWSYGMRLDGFGDPQEEEIDALEAAARAFQSSGATKFHESAYLEVIKVADISPDGHYTPGTNSVERILVPHQESGGTQPTYPQITLAVSLLGAIPRQAAGRGRFYPPPTCHVVDGSGRIAVAQQGAYLGAARTFLDAVNDAGLGDVTIFSFVHEAKQKVAEVRVGRVFDTQRRRRSSLSEEYVNEAVEPG